VPQRRADDETVAADKAEPPEDCEERDRSVDRVKALERERHRVPVGSGEREPLGEFDTHRHPRARFAHRQAASEFEWLDVCRAQRMFEGRDNGRVLNEYIPLRNDADRRRDVSLRCRRPNDHVEASIRPEWQSVESVNQRRHVSE